MTLKTLCESGRLALACGPADKEITGVYCGDLLSRVMGKAPAGSAWVTVMGNVNAVAVASLCEVGAMVLAEGARLDEAAAASAEEHGIAVALSPDPIYETAAFIGGRLGQP